MSEEIKVNQKSPNVFFFKRKIRKSDKIKVYLLRNPNDKDMEELFETSESSFEINLNIDYRPYFLIKYGDGDQLIIAERTLPVEGMNNFRDMGGYETEDGHRVKWGLLYRSDHIHNATDEGVKYLRKLGLKSIIDFRSDDEIEKYPNKVISNDVNIHHFDPSAHTAELAAQFQSSKEDEDENLVNEIIAQKKGDKSKKILNPVYDQYRTFVNSEDSKRAFANMLKVIANPDAPAVVQHCRGGKDRTGYGAMLILGILGVSKEDILADYLVTKENRKKRNQLKMNNYRKLTDDPLVLEQLYAYIDAKSDFLEKSIDEIVESSGSIKDYVINDLRINPKSIDTMKSLYLN